MPKRRRRPFTAELEAQVVLEVLTGLKSQAEVARQHKLKVDNRKRIHSAPGDLTPAEFERKWLRGQKALSLQ